VSSFKSPLLLVGSQACMRPAGSSHLPPPLPAARCPLPAATAHGQEGEEQRRLTALELVARSKPREGVAMAEVAEVTYHMDRRGTAYCRVKMRVLQWYAGVQGDAGLKQLHHTMQQGGVAVPVTRVPSMCLAGDVCAKCGQPGEVLLVRVPVPVLPWWKCQWCTRLGLGLGLGLHRAPVRPVAEALPACGCVCTKSLRVHHARVP
jgi:hypothetical protein